MDEARLIEKLAAIEALFAGAATPGEREAADRARQRIRERLARDEVAEPPKVFRFSMPDMWSRKVFVALLRRYGIRPFRYKGQRYTTVMARVPGRFVHETLWPEFEALSETLRSYLSDVTDRVVRQVIHDDSSDAEVVERAEQLESSVSEAPNAPPAPPEVTPTGSKTPTAKNSAVGSGGRTGAGRGKRKKSKKRKRR